MSENPVNIVNTSMRSLEKTYKSENKKLIFKKLEKRKLLRGYRTVQEARNTVAKDLFRSRHDPITMDLREKFLRAEEERKKLEEVSIIDPLTKMYLRRFLEGNPEVSPPQKGILEREVERTLKNVGGNKKLTVAMLDIDHFKQVNDKYGHPVGDKVLRRVAEVVLRSIRFNLGDFAIRYGGDEFLIIVPNDLDVAKKIIEKIRGEIEKISFDNDDKYPKNITISCGLTNLAENGNDGNYKEIADAMTNRADRALYESKRKDEKNHTTVALHNEDGTTEFIKVPHESKV